jgi:protein disulfide-isomerase A6
MIKTTILLTICVAFAIAQVDLDVSNFDDTIKGKYSFVKFYAPWCGHCKNMIPAYEQVAESFAKEKSVVIGNVDADQHKELGSRYGVSGFPTLKFFTPTGEVENYEGGRTAEDIIAFINSKAGTNIKIKKAPSFVVDLTSENFDSIVLDKSKDVLVEFYAPWCGHCKKLIPDYEKLAAAYAAEKNVVIAKVDADAHKDVGGKFGVTGFPTLMWFGKDNKENPERYEQGRDVPSFVSYINNKAGTSRQANGRLGESHGRLERLDAFAKSFLTGDQAATLTEVEEAVKSFVGDELKNAQYYVKVMQTIVTKGKDFVETELARLTKLTEGSLAPAKVDEFTVRQNILKAFRA